VSNILQLYNSAKETRCCISMSPLKTFYIVDSYIYDNNSDKGTYCCGSMGNNGYANALQCRAVGTLYCVRNPSIWLDKPSNIAFKPIIEPGSFPIQSLLQAVWPCFKSCRHYYNAHVATVTP